MINDSIELINFLQIDAESSMASALNGLSQAEFSELMAIYSPNEDALIHVDSEGFAVNHGNVGSKGIRYDFTR
jgi:hypothetical protein